MLLFKLQKAKLVYEAGSKEHMKEWSLVSQLLQQERADNRTLSKVCDPRNAQF